MFFVIYIFIITFVFFYMYTCTSLYCIRYLQAPETLLIPRKGPNCFSPTLRTIMFFYASAEQVLKDNFISSISYHVQYRQLFLYALFITTYAVYYCKMYVLLHTIYIIESTIYNDIHYLYLLQLALIINSYTVHYCIHYLLLYTPIISIYIFYSSWFNEAHSSEFIPSAMSRPISLTSASSEQLRIDNSINGICYYVQNLLLYTLFTVLLLLTLQKCCKGVTYH